ncbi:MAG: peptide-methionine (S)-S-oxide reductase MsrA [Rhizobiales bacterium]|nr:peptide-methionine (S)-S-oxide reductase MsrA [Hyphomicrobiales bacterium]
MTRAALATLALMALLVVPAHADKQVAIFAGGCFWCVESDFDHVPGVLSTTSGYIGGTTQNPTYYDHTAAGHREAVRVEFDNARVSYEELVSYFFHSVDPTDASGQFCDRGHSYTTAIYTLGDDELAVATKGKAAAEKELKKPIVTEIAAAPEFWPAEDYHQDYYKKNPLRYEYYRHGCGRDARVEALWGANARKSTVKGS